MTTTTLTVGPAPFGQIEGDVFARVAERLDEMGSNWTELAHACMTSRQNLQRAMKLQAALRLETLRLVLDGLRQLAGKPKARTKNLKRELEALGLQLVVEVSPETEEAVLEAAAVITRRAK